MKKEEVWKQVIDFPNYEISNLGNVKSLKRMVKWKTTARVQEERILKPATNNNGYLFVVLTNDLEKKQKSCHHLVAESFLGYKYNESKKLVVNHKDFNKKNNNLDNLEIITQRENITHYHINNKALPTGVFYNEKTDNYSSSINFKGRLIRLGTFSLIKKASNAYQEALKSINENTFVAPELIKRKAKYKGVYYNRKSGRWSASARVNKSNYNIGTYNSEEDAYNARERFLNNN